MKNNLENKFFTDLISDAYQSKDAEFISEKLQKDLKVNVNKTEVAMYLQEDYEKENRTVEYSLNMNQIFNNNETTL